MKEQLSIEISVRYLPSSPMADKLHRMFPSQNDTLGTLVNALNSDADFSRVSHELRAGKDSFLVTTPRLRVRFFPDRKDRNTVILTGAEANGPDRWASDRRIGIACRITWTTGSVYADTGRDTLLQAVKTPSDASMRATPFWEFWSDLLNKEQEKINDLRSFPGWAYRSRRPGSVGEIEFECEEAEDILARCSGSFLVPQVRADGQKDDRIRLAFFQAVPGRTAGRLSGLAREKKIIAQLPKQGVIQLDWISAAAELKRRRTTLDRLLTGQAAFPGLKDMLPSGPTEAREKVAFSAILEKPYNEDQQDAIGKALAEDTVTCILGPPGTARPR